jgi:hypothetical protein
LVKKPPTTCMKLESLHIGLKVKHPQYGIGVVRALSEHAAEIRFDIGVRAVDPQASGLEPSEPQVSITGLEVPLSRFVDEALEAVLYRMGWESPEAVATQLGVRWLKGRLVMHPSDTALQPKEVPLEVFFHKIVGMRNQLRVLEQKINSHPQLSDADKVEMQQYVSRCHGSMTTFNLLFRNKEDQFSS